MFKVKYVKFIVLSLLMSMILVGCSSISIQEDTDEEGTIKLSQLLESNDLVLYFVWDERSNNIEQLNENTKDILAKDENVNKRK